MKFRLAAAIALYFLLTLLFSTLSNTSSLEKKRHNHAIEQKWKTFSRLLVGICKRCITQTSLLPQRENYILSLVINQFLTCKDIIVLRKTCYDFQYLLHPNDANVVTFCIYGSPKTMTGTNIIWEDLKYFLKQNYYSAFYEMKMFNIKENEYAVLTRVLEEKYIVWSNTSIPYYKMLLGKTTLFTPLHNYHKKDIDPMKVFNKRKSAWAMITKEGHVLTGGDKNYGGYSSLVQSQLKNVKMISSTNGAFAALLDNGTVVGWGDEDDGGKIPDAIQIQLVNVKKIFSTYLAFAVLLDNGNVVAWGNENYGGKIPDDIQNQLVNVKMIYSTRAAFAALLDDGTVRAWGNENYGGKIPLDIQNKMIKNVKMIFSTNYAFSALLNDATVIAWGYEDDGGKIPDAIKIQLVDVKQIIPTQKTFTALCKTGNILTWGDD